MATFLNKNQRFFSIGTFLISSEPMKAMLKLRVLA